MKIVCDTSILSKACQNIQRAVIMSPWESELEWTCPQE